MQGRLWFAFSLMPVAMMPAMATAQVSLPESGKVFGARSLALSPDGKRLAFSYLGDVWVAPAEGGRAVPLTTHIELDDNPVWSPDGRTIAFSSNRFGNSEIFVVSADGGVPRRVTFHSGGDVPSDFTPDGKGLLVRASRDQAINGVYTIDLATGRFRNLFLDNQSVGSPKFSRDGKRILYTRLGFPWVRPRYEGSAASQLWIYDVASKKRIEVRNNGFQHLWPNWVEDVPAAVTLTDKAPSSSYLNKPIGRVVFSAPRTPNILGFDGGKVRRMTNFAVDGVRFFSAARNAPVAAFERNGEVMLMDTRSGAVNPVNLTASVDEKFSNEERLILTAGASEASLSPDNSAFVFTIRGELWSVPVKKGTGPNKDDATQLTTYEGLDEDPIHTPDGKAIFFVSDRNGARRLFRMVLESKETSAVTTVDADVSNLQVTPDGKQLAFCLNGQDGGLYVVNVDGTGLKKVLSRPSAGGFDYSFSPDMRWVAYGENLVGSGYYFWENGRNVHILEIATGESTNVTQLNALHANPNWSPDGKYLYFQSNRNGDGIYVLPLQKEDQRPNEITLSFTKPKDPVKVEIDFDEIETRSRRLVAGPVFSSYEIDPEDGSIYYLNNGDIARTNFNGEETRNLTSGGGIGGFSFARDKKALVFIRNGEPSFMPVRTPQNPVTQVDFRADWTRDVRKERRAAFYQFWREYNRGFYDANFHGRDWLALRRKYEPFLTSIGHRNEFATLLNMMVGELESSHSEVGASPGNPGSQQSAHLGFTFDTEFDGPGIKVLTVPKGTPGSFAKTQLSPGEIVLKVNGKDVLANEALYRDVLNEQIGREVRLTVKGLDGKERTVTYRAISGGEFNAINFRNLLERRRKQVEERSGGRLTYVHIAGMGGGELDRFQQQVWQQMRGKQGLIIDVRNNGGGNTSDRIIDILERRQNSWYQERDQAAIPGPGQTTGFPMVVMHAESSFSNAEMFPYAMKARGLATLVGMPTPGYVIYTGGFNLIDGTSCRMPGTGVFRLDGSPLENMGQQPDVRVDLSPEDFLAQRDPQLDRAVDVLLRQLK